MTVRVGCRGWGEENLSGKGRTAAAISFERISIKASDYPVVFTLRIFSIMISR
jgi:hypothetical protein